MGEFRAKLKIEDLNDGTYEMLEALPFKRDNGEIITIPAGFITDFFTVPEPLQPVAPKVPEKGKAAAVLHDYVLQHMSKVYSRKEANKIFKEALLATGVKSWRASVYYHMTELYSKYVKLKDKFGWLVPLIKLIKR